MYTYRYTHIFVLFSLYESEFLLISESKQGGFYKNPLLLLVEDIRWLVARDHRRRNGCWSLSKNCIHKTPITTLYQTDSLHLLSLSVYLWYPCLCVSLWVCVSVSVPPLFSVSLSLFVISLCVAYVSLCACLSLCLCDLFWGFIIFIGFRWQQRFEHHTQKHCVENAHLKPLSSPMNVTINPTNTPAAGAEKISLQIQYNHHPPPPPTWIPIPSQN